MNEAAPSVPAPKFVIRLDKSRPFSECRGERTPDDPHYRVHFWQGRKVGPKIILLPFDASGIIVEDDGKTAKYMGTTVDGKAVEHHPLYNADMRALVERMQTAAAKPAPAFPPEEAPIEYVGEASDPADSVNFASYLRGEARYTPQELRAAVKSRYHLNIAEIPEIVRHLVLDDHVVPEDQVCPALAGYIKQAA